MDETGSTNADLLAEVERGEAVDRTVLITGHQTAGRGRLDRRWDAPPGSNLLMSILFTDPPAAPAVLTQMVGIAAVEAISALMGPSEVAASEGPSVSSSADDAGSAADAGSASAGQGGNGHGNGEHGNGEHGNGEHGKGEQGSGEIGSDGRTSDGPGSERRLLPALKWPNDVLVGDRKLAGVLAQRAATGEVVVGCGLNVGWAPDGAASLRSDLGLDVDARRVADAMLRVIDGLSAADVAARYRRHLATLGRRVRVELPGDRVLVGTAVDVDPDGRLVVEDDPGTERHVLDVGDVVHLRPA